VPSNDRSQLACAYSCYAFIVIFTIGFLALADFVPPPHPTASAASIAHLFRSDSLRIRVGMAVCLLASALLLPWGGAVGDQIKRIEGGKRTLSYTWVTASALLTVEFIYPCLWWAVAAFRTDVSPQIIRSYDDMAWLGFMGIISTALVQCAVLAIATFKDKREQPLFPRWFGYVNAWCTVLMVPDAVTICWHTGPFAWNGILTFWFVITVAFIWLIVVTIVTARAIKIVDETPTGTQSLEDRVDELERRLELQAGATPAR
jgi:hypothetical protein